MSKSILVSTDFSAADKSAIELALKLCGEMRCALILLHTYRLINNKSGDVVAWKRTIEAEARAQFSVIEESLLRGSGIKYTPKIEVGFLADRVVEAIRKNEIILLVTDRLMYSRSKLIMDELVERTSIPIVLGPLLHASVTDVTTSTNRSPGI